MTKDDHTEPQRCRPDLFQETSLICRNPDLRLALQPALAALIERVMGAEQPGTGGDA